MNIAPAFDADLDEAVACLAAAFAQDPITGFLLGTGPGYRERVMQFFSLLMRARIVLHMPVLLARDTTGIQGAAMGYTTLRPEWPQAIANDWARFEKDIPGLTDRMAVYDEIAAGGVPQTPHYYLGVIGTEPSLQGRGVGAQLLTAFCELSARDPSSSGVYLETATASNLAFYRRAGFVETGCGRMESATLWCLFRPHGQR